MKKLSMILLFTVFLNAAGQNVRERVMLFTDRSLYITGEKVSFSALLSSDSESSILYCEIISQKGYAVAAGKFNIDKLRSSGSIALPSDLVTGNYFLRAYTKMMRNDGPSAFSYMQITVINPYLDEVLSSSRFADTSNLTGSMPKTLPVLVKIIPDKTLAIVGDSIHVSLYNVLAQHSFNLVSVAVVPDSLPHYPRVMLQGSAGEKQRFAPEVNGPSVSGSVLDKTYGKPVKDAAVNLSILGKGHDFMSVKTDTAGRFSFTLKGYSGYRELFLCPGDDSVQKIMLDNDFCTVPLTIPASHFSLSEAERRTVYRMALNAQVDSLFRIKEPVDTTPVVGIEDAYFYGTPDETITIGNYVKMPAIEDYFRELPTQVKIRKSGGQQYFMISGNQSMLDEFPPLVMLDLVALNNLKRILEIPPRDLDRIEVINSIYVKGEQLYGGIINFISRRGDFAGISLPASGVLVRYGFPDAENDEKNTMRQSGPDARNTVLWIPHLSLTNESKISFTAPSTPGRYVITVKGVTSEGMEFSSSSSFYVSSIKPMPKKE